MDAGDDLHSSQAGAKFSSGSSRSRAKKAITSTLTGSSKDITRERSTGSKSGAEAIDDEPSSPAAAERRKPSAPHKKQTYDAEYQDPTLVDASLIHYRDAGDYIDDLAPVRTRTKTKVRKSTNPTPSHHRDEHRVESAHRGNYTQDQKPLRRTISGKSAAEKIERVPPEYDRHDAAEVRHAATDEDHSHHPSPARAADPPPGDREDSPRPAAKRRPRPVRVEDPDGAADARRDPGPPRGRRPDAEPAAEP